MATVQTTISYTDGGVRQLNHSKNRNTTGTSKVNQVITVGFSGEEQYTIPTDIGTKREVFVANLDTTNFVELGFVSTSVTAHPIKLQPAGQPDSVAVCPGVSTLWLKADTANCEVQIIVQEE